ncbi:FtsX-like permease family protein [Paenibacillus sp. N1-5-1-14]|uniref:ABC transporter permease n=1 Tax=Paenibacillus radicibacter TaxID=2972488 RepID=UPI00215948C0|nr:FtsX-like permease family protein [Paenibacillus radicibacter]MCR8641691.1 FtsX-like permease family protein [Paenibacillus radicibacter]
MLKPRWKKVWQDLWSYKAKTALVVLSITLGVMSVGILGQAKSLLEQGMDASYKSAHASNFTLFTKPYESKLLDSIKQMPDIGELEERAIYSARINVNEDASGQPTVEDWRDLRMTAIADYNAVKMDTFYPDQGVIQPQKDEIVLERTALPYLNVQVVDEVWIEMPTGLRVKLKLVGTVYDPGKVTASIDGVNFGYINYETLVSLQLPKLANTISVQVNKQVSQEDDIKKLAANVRDEVYAQGGHVYSTWIPEQNKHWASNILQSQAVIFEQLGLLILILGSIIVINTIFALLTGQMKQMGVMQVIGATPNMLIRMYISVVLLYGLIALCIGVPIGLWGGRLMAGLSVNVLNFDTSAFGISPQILLIQIAVSLVIPLLAGLYPIMLSTRVTLLDLINGRSAGGDYGHSRIDRLIERIKGISRPMLLSLRNTVRRKGRLVMTLIILSLGCAMTLSVLSAYASTQRTTDNSIAYSNYDISYEFATSYPASDIERVTSQVSGVTKFESWGSRTVNRVRADGVESDDFTLVAPPAGSQMIRPEITKGRWLAPDDRNGIVIESYVLVGEPDLDVGQEITLKIGGKESTWHIVGIARKVAGSIRSYVNYDALVDVTGASGQVDMIQIVTGAHDRDAQAKAAAALSEQYRGQGFLVNTSQLTTDLHDIISSKMSLLINLLTVLVVLLMTVAGLGLMGTMSLNVMDLTREIGIMRSIGASDYRLWWIIVAEGLIIGVISWVIGCLLAIPISQELCKAIGLSLFKSPLDYVYPISGVVITFVMMVTLSILASFGPAWNASRLAVRDILSYE